MRRAAAIAGAAAALLLIVATPAGAAPGPARSPEYWFDTWHVMSLWNTGARGQGVTIAEIDTGVNAAVPELKGRILPGTDLGRGGNGQVDRATDDFGHGTAMASIMVARPGLLDITGLAPAAKILPIAVPLNGTTDAGDPDEVPQAIRYAADHAAKIINLSLGGKRSPSQDSQPCNDAEQSAIDYAVRKGSLVIASVGNTGPTKNTIEDPGVCLGVLSVGAVQRSGAVADFSARQPYLTLVAPGVDIPSLGRFAGQAFRGDGTSQATAITSAAAALVWSRYPTLTASQVGARLIATLDDHRSTPSPAYGYGLLDAYRAVTEHVPPDAPNPVYAAVQPFLARVDALAATRPAAPNPAAKPIASTGSYVVGSRSGVTAQLIIGVVIGGLGAVLVLAMLVVGVRARRPWNVGMPVPVDASPMAPAPADPASRTPIEEPPPRRRPSPRPYPDSE